jgi:hypothetical protein
MSANAARLVLEPAAQAFAEATAHPPYLFDLGPVEGREVVDQMQPGAIAKPPRSTSRTPPSLAALRVRSRCASCGRGACAAPRPSGESGRSPQSEARGLMSLAAFFA